MLKYYNDNILIFVRNLESSHRELYALIEGGATGNPNVDLSVVKSRVTTLENQVASLNVPTVTDSVLSNDTSAALSANQGRLLNLKDLKSGKVSGRNLVLEKTDGSEVTIDVTNLIADVKLKSGKFNSITNDLELVISDTNVNQTIKIPVGDLLKVQTHSSLSGDGTSTSPLKVEVSSDTGNVAKLGSDFKLFVPQGNAIATKNLASLSANTWTAIPASGFTKDSSFRVYDGAKDITETISIRRAASSFEILSLLPATSLVFEIQGVA